MIEHYLEYLAYSWHMFATFNGAPVPSWQVMMEDCCEEAWGND